MSGGAKAVSAPAPHALNDLAAPVAFWSDMGEDNRDLGQFDVLDHAPVGMCVLDEARRVLFWNRCLEHWTGVARTEILGEDIAKRYPHFETPRYSLRLQAIHQGGAPAIFSSQLHGHLFPSPLPNGQFRTQHTTVTAVPAPGDRGFLALFAVEDVTEMTHRIQAHRQMRDQALEEIEARKLAEHKKELLLTRLHEAQKRESLNVMAGSIAHNFNNMLMAMLGFLEMVMAEMPRSANSFEKIERAYASAQQAKELSRLMLTYVGQADVELDTVSLSGLVEGMAEVLEASLTPGTALTLCPEQDPAPLRGDPVHLRQLVENLVINAAEAIGDEGGAVTLATGTVCYDPDASQVLLQAGELSKGNYAFLDVADTGCGMNSETLARVLDPFFTTKFTGRGLGLAAVLGIVRAHCGGIAIKSEPGKGTSIRILFPSVSESMESEPKQASSFPKEPRLDSSLSGTVLVVDDDAGVRGSCGAMLRRLGMDVLTAADGQEAIEVFLDRSDTIDCVILDLTMPGMSGEATLQELRRIRGDVQAVLTSGYAEQDLTHAPSTPRGEPFIQKPFRLSRLRSVLNEVLAHDAGEVGT